MPITHTTRPAEAGEEDGVHFYFAARPEMEQAEREREGEGEGEGEGDGRRERDRQTESHSLTHSCSKTDRQALA